MTKPLAEQFEEKCDILFTHGGLSVLLDYPPHDMVLDVQEVKKWLTTAETEIRADAEKQANDHLKAIIGMERDMAKVEERARVVEWAKKEIKPYETGKSFCISCRKGAREYYNQALKDLLSFLAKENK